MSKVWCVIAGVVLLLPPRAPAQRKTGYTAGLLAALRDKARPLLIFYPAEGAGRQSAVGAQRALFLGHEADLEERNVTLVFIPVNDSGFVAADALTEVRKRFRIDSGRFTVVLVGKDGGEKFRSHEPVTIGKLAAVIDAMPMRQQEVKDGHHPD